MIATSQRLVLFVDKQGKRPDPVLGARQGTCRLSHAALGCILIIAEWAWTTASRSGFKVTAPMTLRQLAAAAGNQAHQAKTGEEHRVGLWLRHCGHVCGAYSQRVHTIVLV